MKELDLVKVVVQAADDKRAEDLVVVDVHLEIDGDLSVKVGHDIAVLARKSVLDNHQVLNVMTHVDPYFKGDNSPGCGGK